MPSLMMNMIRKKEERWKKNNVEERIRNEGTDKSMITEEENMLTVDELLNKRVIKMKEKL